MIYQEELEKKYDIENIFKTRKATNEGNNEAQVYMVEYKKNIFEKIWDKIKQLFNKKI